MTKSMAYLFSIRGGSRKKIEKKIIPSVPTKRKVYTKASIAVIFGLDTSLKSTMQSEETGGPESLKTKFDTKSNFVFVFRIFFELKAPA